jgi:hypothetical protein
MKKKVLLFGAIFTMGALFLSSNISISGIERRNAQAEVVLCPSDSDSVCNMDGETFDGYYEISIQVPEIARP